MGILKGLKGRVSLIQARVTQTNDPMGILKEGREHYNTLKALGYTDQRSDGDTERSTTMELGDTGRKLHRPTIRWGY